MLKRLTFFVVVISLLLGVACSSNQNAVVEPTASATQEQLTPASQTVAETTVEPVQEPSATTTVVPAETATNTPMPPTATPSPTPIPTETPTPRPINHANVGWEGYDAASRTPFPDETRIIDEILTLNQNNQMLNSVTAEDIRILWYTADDGTDYWYPYFTVPNDRLNNDLFLYIYPLQTDANGNLALVTQPKMLNVSGLERLELVQNLTDIKLIWDDRTGKPVLVIEKQGRLIWYPDETRYILVSYEQDLSRFGIPDKPEPADDYMLALFPMYPQDYYLFNYDEAATASSGIANPQNGPVYQLANNRWQPVDPPDFIGGGPAQFAYIGVDDAGNGNLYIEQLTSLKTQIQIWSNIHQPLAPAHVARDAEASDHFGYDYYYLLASPVWSPNGEKVAFITQENGSPYLAVYDVQGETWQSLVQLPQSAVLFEGPIWSPDGAWLAYSYRTSDSADFDTLRVVSYPEASDYYIDEGTRMQWIEDDEGLHLNYEKFSGELFLADPDGSNIEEIIYSASRQNLNNPVDGFALIEKYVPEQDAFLVHRYKQEDGFDKLVHVPLDGSEEILLAELPTDDGACSYSKFLISPDNTWLLTYKSCFEDSVSTFQGFYLLNLQTQESQEAPDYWQYRFIEGWTPDSKGIVEYTTFGVNVYDVYGGDLTSNGRVYTGIVYPLKAVLRTLGNDGVLYWPDAP